IVAVGAYQLMEAQRAAERMGAGVWRQPRLRHRTGPVADAARRPRGGVRPVRRTIAGPVPFTAASPARDPYPERADDRRPATDRRGGRAAPGARLFEPRWNPGRARHAVRQPLHLGPLDDLGRRVAGGAGRGASDRGRDRGRFRPRRPASTELIVLTARPGGVEAPP